MYSWTRCADMLGFQTKLPKHLVCSEYFRIYFYRCFPKMFLLQSVTSKKWWIIFSILIMKNNQKSVADICIIPPPSAPLKKKKHLSGGIAATAAEEAFTNQLHLERNPTGSFCQRRVSLFRWDSSIYKKEKKKKSYFPSISQCYFNLVYQLKS